MTVIQVKNVWKKYRLYYEKRPSLKETILFRGRGKWEEFWVLKDINLRIEKGTTIGLIGQNGSGKSTLLKLLTKIIYPNRGEIDITGRVSSLLELGAGFHPDFTGRENIYFNSSVFGLTKNEIDKRLDEIIEFAELGDFIDNPVRSYSSGMYMRLAFATAINVDPDILLIDEVLAVGDTAFQKKCFDKINEFKTRGKTIVFVSHDNGLVEKLCDVAVWIHDGTLKDIGKTKKVVNAYLTELQRVTEDRLAKEHQVFEVFNEIENNTSTETETVKNNDCERWGSREIEIKNVKMFDGLGREKYLFESGEYAQINIYYQVNKAVDNPVFGIGFFKDNINCYGTNTQIDKFNIQKLINIQGVIKFKIKELNFIEGKYFIDVAVHHEDGRAYDYQTKRFAFSVFSKVNDIGIARMKHYWDVVEGG